MNKSTLVAILVFTVLGVLAVTTLRDKPERHRKILVHSPEVRESLLKQFQQQAQKEAMMKALQRQANP